MADSLITPAMREAVGRTGEARTATVERGAIARFAEAIGDDNPAYPDVAPPTFLRSVGLATPDMPDGDSLPRVLDGGSEWTFSTPVRPGDVISFSTVLENLVERSGRLGAMVIATYATEYANQDGVVVAVQRNTLIRMAAA
ncbi:MAG: MaoC family dehydratase N-terminal domain-containing protein [Dehalococcoidia bacterium]